jgi:hypothetical protein
LAILSILEIGGNFRLKAALKNELPIEVMRTMVDWVDYFHHQGGAAWLDVSPSPDNLVYEVIRPGDKGILVQGDSWMELMELNPISGKPNKSGQSIFYDYLDPKFGNIGYINAGVGSFSPSLADGQLRFLRERKSIDPKYIFFYMDQTDLGDEIFRYANYVRRSDGWLVGIDEDKYFQFKSQYGEIVEFSDSRFKSLGLIKYELGKIYRKLFKDQDITQLDTIISPLARGATPAQQKFIESAIDGYIQQALKSTSLEKLVLVAHPHLRHLTKENSYQDNAYDYLVGAFNRLSSDQKKRICVAYITPEKFYEYKAIDEVFREGDPTSHLTPDFQFRQFPIALAKTVNKCVFN